ncbi:MAG: hypothetical protein KDD42_10360, partial [Bdellovibrionales bacterium]|nr:hypothetical protein [Bdellovibrionales bacterium]
SYFSASKPQLNIVIYEADFLNSDHASKIFTDKQNYQRFVEEHARAIVQSAVEFINTRSHLAAHATEDGTKDHSKS